MDIYKNLKNQVRLIRRKRLSENFKFNLVLSAIITLLPLLILLILIKASINWKLFTHMMNNVTLIIFIFIPLTSYLKHILRKNKIINMTLFAIYLIAIFFGFLFFIYYLYNIIVIIYGLLFWT